MSSQSLQPRRISNTGKSALPFCMGGNAFGWGIKDDDSVGGILDHYVANGFSLLDTADVYPKWVPGNVGGESETLIGNWIKSSGKRDQICLISKCGGEMGPGKKGLSASYLKEAVEASMRRLQTDYIDIYMAHYDDPETPFEETLQAFDDLIKEGKIGAIGLSNHSAERLKEALAVSKDMGLPTYSSIQLLYNLYDREEFETLWAPVCRENDIAVMSFRSLCGGFLSGKYRSENDLAAATRVRVNKVYMNERGFKILNAVDQVAANLGARQAEVALAWVIAQADICAPLSSVTSIQQLDELIAATQLQLDAESLEILDRASVW